MMKIFGSGDPSPNASAARPSDGGSIPVRPPLRPPLRPSAAAGPMGANPASLHASEPRATLQADRNQASAPRGRRNGGRRIAVRPAVHRHLHADPLAGGSDVEQPRWAPETISATQAKTWLFPPTLKKSIEELRAQILSQREAKPGEYTYPDGTRYPRWWNGAVTFESMRLRYAVSMTAFGETWVVVRRVPLEIPRIDMLGIPAEATTILKRLGTTQSGLILVAGATSAGKTTTAVAMLGEFLRKFGKVAYTIEDPAEYKLGGLHGDGFCIQTEAEYNGGFLHAIKTALRSFPNYILIGEIRDTPVALSALQASMSGHLVISTLHAGAVSDALDAFIRLVHGSASESIREQFAQQLVAIVHQTRNNGRITMNIMEITPQIRKDLRRLMSENKTGALGDESWVKTFEPPQA